MTIRATCTQRVESVPSTGTIREAARRMREADVGMLVVMDEGRCIGVVTDRHRRLLVVGDDGEPAGVVSLDDVVQRLATLISQVGDVVHRREFP